MTTKSHLVLLTILNRISYFSKTVLRVGIVLILLNLVTITYTHSHTV